MISPNSKWTISARVLLGLIFTIFGLNGFLNFLPAPEVPREAGSFLGALAATGYMFPLIKGTEVVAGLVLLSNRLVPLSLLLLAPVIVNIVAFHVFLAPAGMVVPLLVLALELFLAYAYRGSFRGIFEGLSATRSEASSTISSAVSQT